VRQDSQWRDALDSNAIEAVAGTVLLATAVAALAGRDRVGLVLAGLLVWHGLGLLAAPVNSLAAARATLPADLRARRATEWLRDRVPSRRRTVSVLGRAVLVGAAASVALALFAPTDVPGGIATDVLAGSGEPAPTADTDSDSDVGREDPTTPPSPVTAPSQGPTSTPLTTVPPTVTTPTPSSSSATRPSTSTTAAPVLPKPTTVRTPSPPKTTNPSPTAPPGSRGSKPPTPPGRP
jgi:hypothetical protein